MKTIILLIFCFSIGMGQNSREEGDTVYIEVTCDDSSIPMPVDQPITREDLFRYAEECYNDSTEIQVYNGCGISGCCVWHGYKDVWIHKEPTFPGFIEWLGKQKH